MKRIIERFENGELVERITEDIVDAFPAYPVQVPWSPHIPRPGDFTAPYDSQWPQIWCGTVGTDSTFVDDITSGTVKYDDALHWSYTSAN